MTTFAERFRNEGKREEALDMLFEALSVKFHSVPQEIKDKISTLNEPPKLKDLLRHVILSNDMREFKEKLNLITG